MSSAAVVNATADIMKALATVPGAVATTDPGATLASLPALVLGPPRLMWESGCLGPTSALYVVSAVVDADERAIERLWALVVEVGDAVDQFSEGVVVQADPGVFPSGTAQLPCYDVQIEVPI
jgi:hypothetical protein